MAFNDEQKEKRRVWTKLRLSQYMAENPELGGNIDTGIMECIMDNIDEFNDDDAVYTYTAQRESAELQTENDYFKAELESRGYVVTIGE